MVAFDKSVVIDGCGSGNGYKSVGCSRYQQVMRWVSDGGTSTVHWDQQHSDGSSTIVSLFYFINKYKSMYALNW
jgi:hypothetical protein